MVVGEDGAQLGEGVGRIVEYAEDDRFLVDRERDDERGVADDCLLEPVGERSAPAAPTILASSDVHSGVT